MRGLIHFAHGNGFPGLCYRQLLDGLNQQFDYCYIDRIGHSDRFPVTENWHDLVQEVIHSIESQAEQPVIGLGHSLGGVLSLLAAIERPELFRQVIMLDSPLLGPVKSSVIRLAKSMGFIDRITPAFQTKGRRQYWQNEEQLLKYLKERPLFNGFDPDCLQDYIDYGLEKGPQGFQLRFDRHIEYLIYRTLPHKLSQYQGRLSIPSAVIYGNRSTVVDKMDLIYMKKKFGIRAFEISGTHMFPFENPKASVEAVISAIESLNRA